jgi:hypothetical protein
MAIGNTERENNEAILQPACQGQGPPLQSALIDGEPEGKSIHPFFSVLNSCLVAQANCLRTQSEERGSSPDCADQTIRREATK